MRRRPSSPGGRRLRALLWLICASRLLPGAAHGQADGGSVVALPKVSVSEHATLVAAPGWPVWLKDYATRERTTDTSGITYAGRDADGRLCFFLADEIGFINLCRVSETTDGRAARLALERVVIDRSLSDALSDHDQWDFEDLSLEWPAGQPGAVGALADSVTALLSVEGRGARYLEQTDVLRVHLVREIRPSAAEPSWRARALGPWVPGARFWEGQAGIDRGIAGIATSAGYTFLGLASLVERGEFNTRGTMLYVYDRGRGRVGQVLTRGLDISSVGGMVALSDTVLVLVDRDRQSLNVIRWDPLVPGQVTACDRFPLELLGPGGFRYAIPSIEGLTIDDRGDLWCVTDPWQPQNNRLLEASAPESLHVYMSVGIPMLYRFPGARVWKETGLETMWEPGK
jgi:hypothetical protein